MDERLTEILDKNLEEMREILNRYGDSGNEEKLEISRIMDKLIVTMQLVKNEYKQMNIWYVVYRALAKELRSQMKTNLQRLQNIEKGLYGSRQKKVISGEGVVYPKRKRGRRSIRID